MVNYPQGEKIRNVINRILVQEGGWQVELDRNPYLNSQAHLDGFGEVNTPEFFRPLLRSLPLSLFRDTGLFSRRGDVALWDG